MAEVTLNAEETADLMTAWTEQEYAIGQVIEHLDRDPEQAKNALACMRDAIGGMKGVVQTKIDAQSTAQTEEDADGA